jgi:hypothetical protein
MRQRWLALVLGLSLVARTAAHAEGASLVTVVRAPRPGPIVDEATTRLTAELRAAGFTVRVVEGTPGVDGRVQVEGASAAKGGGGKADGSFATIAILETDRGAAADVWVADHVTKKTLVRRVDVATADLPNGASDLAVRSAELLRASLLEIRGSTAPTSALPADLSHWLDRPLAPIAAPPAPAPALTSPPAEAFSLPVRSQPAAAVPSSHKRPLPAETRAPAAPAKGHVSFEAAFGVLAGGSGAVPQPVLRLGLELPITLALRATVAPPAAAITRSAAAGSVALRQTAAALGLTYTYPFEHARLYPMVALGAGLYHLRVDGEASPPYRGEHHTALTGALTLGAGLGVRLTPNLMARAELDLFAITKQLVVTIVDKEAWRAGRPMFLPSLGLSATF